MPLLPLSPLTRRLRRWAKQPLLLLGLLSTVFFLVPILRLEVSETWLEIDSHTQSEFKLLFSCSFCVTLPLVIDIILDYINMRNIPFLPHRILSTLSLFITNLIILFCITIESAGAIILTLFLWSYFIEFSIVFTLLFALNNYTSYRPLLFTLSSLSIFSFFWCGQLSITNPLNGYSSTTFAFIGLIAFITLIYVQTIRYSRYQYHDYLKSKAPLSDWIRGLKESTIFTIILTVGLHLQIIAFIVIFFINRKFSFDQGFFHADDVKWLVIIRTIFFAFSYFLSARLFRNKLIRNNQDLAFKTQLIKYFSHEIRSPIMVISVALELIEDSMKIDHGKDPENIREFIKDNLSDVRSACDQSVEIFDTMLLYEKIEAGELRPDFRVVDPLEGIRQVLRSLTSWAQHCDVGLYMKYSPAEFEVGPRKIRVDDVKLKAVFQALFTSAFKLAKSRRISEPVDPLEEHMGRPRLIVDRDSLTAEFVPQEDYFASTELSLRLYLTLDDVHGKHAASNVYGAQDSGLSMERVLSESSLSTRVAIEFQDTSGDITESDILQMNSRSLDFTRKGYTRLLFNFIDSIFCRRHEDGIGLGYKLWIAKRIMRLHDGDLSIVSSDDGVSIALWLPLSDENQRFPNSSGQAMAPAPSARSFSNSFRSQRVSPLVVEPPSNVFQLDRNIAGGNNQLREGYAENETLSEKFRRGTPSTLDIQRSLSQDNRRNTLPGRCKILVVDDSPMVRKMIRKLMGRYGFIRIVSTGNYLI